MLPGRRPLRGQGAGTIGNAVFVMVGPRRYPLTACRSRGTEELAAPPAEPGGPARAAPALRPARERSLLLDAASAVLGTKGWASVTVADILGEAGLATRSFYRHFASKDELLRSLVRRDAERFAAAVTARVDAAPAPAPPSSCGSTRSSASATTGGGPSGPRCCGRPRRRQRCALDELRRAVLLLQEPLAAAPGRRGRGRVVPRGRARGGRSLVSAMAWDTAGRTAEVASPAAKAGLRAGNPSL